jgi:FKBP-type peptidyl-prolyl cis-trans isomerase SlpA
MIKVGSQVTMHFTIKLEDNSIAEATKNGQPSVFVVTEESLRDPVESQLIGKSVGDKIRVKLRPEQGYGDSLPENIHVFPRDRFKDEIELGDIYQFDRPDGSSMPGLITKISDMITVDFNHPLAGKNLLVELEVCDIFQH